MAGGGARALRRRVRVLEHRAELVPALERLGGRLRRGMLRGAPARRGGPSRQGGALLLTSTVAYMVRWQSFTPRTYGYACLLLTMAMPTVAVGGALLLLLTMTVAYC